MTQEFERRLAEALAGLDRGEDIDTLLAEYPDAADDLAPLLETAAYARETLDFFEPPTTAGLAAGRRRMLEAAARKRARAKAPRWKALAALTQWFRTPVRGLATAALLLVLLVAAGSATVVAAADSVPGDLLYGVKRTSERVRLTLTTDPAARAALHEQYNRERQAEARAVADMGRRARLRFEGVLERRTDGTWVVDGIELRVDRGVVEGEPTLGSRVVVDVASPGDGTLHVEHMTMQGGPHGPAAPTEMPGGPGPMHEPSRTALPATPTVGHRMPATRVAPTEAGMPTHEPVMPMPTDSMQPGWPGYGPQPQPTDRSPMMQQPTASPQPMHGRMGPGMGRPTATPVPTQEPELIPTQVPPTQAAPADTPVPESTEAPPTDTPVPEPTHHGPMMPFPTHTPGGGGHPGGPGGGGHPGGPGGGGHRP